ncbi:MAG: hypothetical protein AB1656_02895 [Candidatus Omnitrophota bacterium]
MSDSSAVQGMAKRLDKLYEFDREPVSEDKLQGGGRFASVFSGEHVAGTEFVIGAFFVLHGVSAYDLLIGLLLGNLLAVLSWTFVCAPIAVRVRLTLYWYLRRIVGPGVTVIYNIANAFLYCILAGSMIAVAATAVGIAFNIDMPSLSDKYPNSIGWVLTVWLVGAVVATVAVLGFKRVSQFSAVCVPWMFLVFIAGAIAILPQVGDVQSLSGFWEVAKTKIWTGVPATDSNGVQLEKYGLWHIIFFAWFCNLAMHVCLSDMALFRFAKHWSYGLYSSLGMYLGHFLAWICSGIMMAGYASQKGFLPSEFAKIAPGDMAFAACGLAGGLAVVLAGWTTANPTIYRAGLALQIVTPNWPRWKMTIVAFIVATTLACFPLFVMKLLDFVAIYGLILMPIGAVVFAEHWLFPLLGLQQYWVEKKKLAFSWPALITWLGVLAICFPASQMTNGVLKTPMDYIGVHLFFRWLPGYFISLIAYIVLASLWGAKQTERTVA